MAEKANSETLDESPVEHLITPTAFNNYGIARLNWHPSMPKAEFVLVAGAPMSDSVPQIIDGIGRLAEFDRRSPEEAFSTEDLSDWLKNTLFNIGEAPVLCAFTPAPKHIKTLQRSQVSTRLIIIYDDVCSLALNAEQTDNQSFVNVLKEQSECIERLTSLTLTSRIPIMAMSAAKARMRPDVASICISDFLGVAASDARLRSAQHFIDDRAPPELKLFESGLSVQGALNRVQTPGTIAGWARIPLSEERLYIMVRSNGVPVADGLAEHYRHDLDAHSIGDGRHGFSIAISNELSEKFREFEVVVPQYDFRVGRIQMSESAVRMNSE